MQNVNERSDFVCNPWEIGCRIGEIVPPSIGWKKITPPNTLQLNEALLIKEKLTHIKNQFSKEEIFGMFSYIDIMKMSDLMDGSGEFLEDYFCYEFKKVNPSLEKGDREDHCGIHFQFKISILTCDKRSACVNRIQKWQEVDQYRIVIIDKQNFYKPYFFVLTKEQMLNELKLCNAASTNGTKSSNKHNRRKFLSIHLRCQDYFINFDRWMEKYNQEFWVGAFGKMFSCKNL